MAGVERPARPTLVSIAEELGVSRQTVSNVLNKPEIVHPVTRERVAAAIKRAGYRPSAAGRALRTQRSMAIGLRLYPAQDGINGAIMDRFVHSLADEAQHHGYQLTLLTADDAEGEVRKLETLYHSGSIDVAVLTDTGEDDDRPDRLREEGMPFVAFGRPWGSPHPDAHPWVDVDGSAGSAEGAAWLRSQGHSAIGFLGWPKGSGVGDDRRGGWARAVSGLPESEDLAVSVSDDHPSAGAEGAEELIGRGATAIVCASDSLALGALGRLRRAGLLDNGPVAPLVGFDDTPVARALGVSSVHQPVEDAAVAVLALAIAAPGADGAVAPGRLLQPKLITRHLAKFAR
jgi:DNA-binding LacI/PurR family transcriptional regulator